MSAAENLPEQDKPPIPGRCIYCTKPVLWEHRTPLCCADCFPRYEAEAKEMLRCVEFYKRKQKEKRS